MLRTPGVDFMEKILLKQRFANLFTAQEDYLDKQTRIISKK